MLAQRLLVDLQLLGDVGLCDSKSRGTLDERALICSRFIFGWHSPFHVAQIRDARALYGKLPCNAERVIAIFTVILGIATCILGRATRKLWLATDNLVRGVKIV